MPAPSPALLPDVPSTGPLPSGSWLPGSLLCPTLRSSRPAGPASPVIPSGVGSPTNPMLGLPVPGGRPSSTSSLSGKDPDPSPVRATGSSPTFASKPACADAVTVAAHLGRSVMESRSAEIYPSATDPADDRHPASPSSAFAPSRLGSQLRFPPTAHALAPPASLRTNEHIRLLPFPPEPDQPGQHKTLAPHPTRAPTGARLPRQSPAPASLSAGSAYENHTL